MKKLLVILLACMMVLTLGACNEATDGDGMENEATVYAGYFTAAIPEGFTAVDEFEDEFVRPIEGTSYEAKIQFKIDKTTFGKAQEQFDKKMESAESMGYTAGEDITLGDITWKVVNFTWDGDTPSAIYYGDVPGQEAYVEITTFMLGSDDAEIHAMLESMTFVDGAHDANQEFLTAAWE